MNAAAWFLGNSENLSKTFTIACLSSVEKQEDGFF